MLPNCIVIGAPRSGTTSAYEYLNAHPEVYMSPVKEPDFFANPILTSARQPAGADGRDGGTEAAETEVQAALAQYEKLFEGAGRAKIRGEASAVYMGDPMAAEHLRHYVPDAKMIAILRDPSERLHSHYMHAMRIRADFGAQEDEQQKRTRLYEEIIDRALRDGWAGPPTTDEEVWLNAGFYYRHLTRFRTLFPESQMIVFRFEEFTTDTRAVMSKVYRFLEIDESFTLPTTEAFNATTVPRNEEVFRFFTTRNPLFRFAKAMSPSWIRGAALRTRNKVLSASKPPLEVERRRKLISIYREDIVKLQDLLGWDLSSWMKDEIPA
jgi:hypothetical protein